MNAARWWWPWLGFAVGAVAGCGNTGSADRLTPDNLTGATVCTAPPGIGCRGSTAYEWDITGVYTIVDCSFIAVSPENADQQGKPCAGTVTIGAKAVDPSGAPTVSFLEAGPNGSGSATALTVFATSCHGCGAGNVDAFETYGTVTVQSQGCSITEDLVFTCAGNSGTPLTCRKASSVRSSTCNLTGWVESLGHYSH